YFLGGKIMVALEKRQYPRVDSANLSYVYLDKNNQVIDHGTGKTRNISEGGFLIETDLELKNRYSVIASIELPEEIVELQGEVVHCTKLDSGKYLAGVMIKDISKGGKPLWKRLISMLLDK
ncbi:MAG: PilZ domain-containing protein, partial [Deltaproteobacteria bacterium]|nr:PilZ domain-containing protein [Deltaproteobacteria bacterium]